MIYEFDDHSDGYKQGVSENLVILCVCMIYEFVDHSDGYKHGMSVCVCVCVCGVLVDHSDGYKHGVSVNLVILCVCDMSLLTIQTDTTHIHLFIYIKDLIANFPLSTSSPLGFIR